MTLHHWQNDARIRAFTKGHRLGEFVRVSIQSTRAKCIRCDATVKARIGVEQGISGKAITESCPKSV